MLTAWLIISALMGVCGMFGELRKGSNVLTVTAGFVCSFVLWPVFIVWMIMVWVIMFLYVAGMKYF